MKMPRTKPKPKNNHQRPVKQVPAISQDLAAELIAAAKQAEINQSHYNGGTYIDYTRPWFDKSEVVK